MRISVINLTHGLLLDREVILAIRAINRQINEDFAPYWNLQGQLRLEGNSSDRPDIDHPEDMQGEAIIYLWDKADIPNALGYHEANYRGIPYGFVFVDIATEINENWTVTLSHEALELIGDRQASKLVRGPDPRDRRRMVYHWHEMCDAVQDETYNIDGIEVSNFVLPLYFTEDAEPGSRNDFLGSQYKVANSHRKQSLQSFGINPGGYIGFYDPTVNQHITQMGPDSDDRAIVDFSSERATKRRNRKNKARMARRGNRYSEMGLKKPVESKPGQELTVDQRKISITCKTSDLVIQTDIHHLKNESRQSKGYFAHDIYSDAENVNKDLLISGFEEIEAIEIEPVTIKAEAERPVAKIGIEHEKDENIIAIIEVDGVLFWQQATTEKPNESVFEVKVQTIDESIHSRRAFGFKGLKTVIRFIKHKFTDKDKDQITNRLDEYLSEKIEIGAFKKEQPALWKTIKLLDKEENKTIGKFEKFTGTLQSGKKYLVLVHGIFSSTKGAFSEFLLNRWDDELLLKLDAAYDMIISFDHWTVAKSTLENATELLALLPENCQLDMVCHSRGAGVVRCLLEHPKLAGKLDQKKIKVGKAVFVAGACQGSPLANPDRLDKLLNVTSALSSIANTFIPLALFTSLLKAARYGVKHFPGIQSMSPDSDIIQTLNEPINQPNCEYIFTRSNYEPTGILKRMLDEIGIDKFIFNGSQNDGVVPFEGAGSFDGNISAVRKGPEFGESDHVYHTSFFEQQEVRQMLINTLTGSAIGKKHTTSKSKPKKSAATA